MKLLAKGILWFGLYLLVILLPLFVSWLRHPAEVEGRAFSLLFSAACGYVGVAVIAFEFVLVSRVGSFARAFGQDALLQFHRQMGLVASLLILIHVFLVFRNSYPLAWLNPFSDGIVQWGTLAAYALVLLIVLSLCRKRFRISYGWWQITHSLLANTILILAVVHVLRIGAFVGPMPIRNLWTVCLLVLLLLFLRYRLVKPILLWRKPWQVAENIEERGDCRTLVLRPVGHEGFTFEPGQFAWLNTGRTPFSRDQHPISFSSTAYDESGRDVAFTIRALGDWSGKTVPTLQAGKRVWLDGPYGVFTADQEQGPGYVLIGGGVGITPFYSLCRTFAERGDQRPVVLFYGSGDWDQLTFRDEFDALQDKMNLKVVYVLSAPGPEWKGETGFINAKVLQRHLPKQFRRMQYFVCGPTPMMDAMEKILPEIGVPLLLIHTERFDMV